MTRKTLAVFLTVCVSAFFSLTANAQMSDDAVISYVKEGMASGKSQQEMMLELSKRGVTKEQAERIRQKMAPGASGRDDIQKVGTQEVSRRDAAGYDEFSIDVKTEGTRVGAPKVNFEDLSVSQRVRVIAQALQAGDSTMLYKVLDSIPAVKQVFGRSVFSSADLTFAPNTNIATPENYKLGPGDEVVIDIWGTNQSTIQEVITPDGYLNIDGIGVVALSGMTVKEAESYMRKKLNQIYSLEGPEAKSQMKLTLGQIRTIQVNVMGEVMVPGTYYLSSLSTIYHALYRAGGVSELGSLRDIRLVRNGETVSSIDIYDFLTKGSSEGDISLQDGDIVLVGAYDMLVAVEGKVKRPMYYEMQSGETMKDLIDFTGGFTGDAYTKNVNVVRRNGKEYQVYTVDDKDFASFKLADCDSVTVGAILDRYENRLEIKGAVYRPGVYQFDSNVATVSALIRKAEGLMGDAFTNRGLIHREKEDMTMEVISFDVKGVMDGSAEDVPLQKNDVVYVPSIHDLNDMGYVSVLGEVARPGSFVYAEGTTLEDVIIQAGGLLESASAVKVDVSRRVKDPYSMEPTDSISKMYSFALKDGFVISGEAGFQLQPYDQVYVRRSPGYGVQTNVTVEGEVLFAGDYSLTHKSQRLSDLVKDAGGVTPWAYVRGARLERRMSPDERARMESTLKMMNRGRDTVDVSMLDLGEVYYVGIDLEKAMAKPGSEVDLVLREGDVLRIPQYVNTVKIGGNVMYPNTVVYDPDMKVKDFVEMAGGYGFRSKKNRAYVIYMNGTVARARKSSRGVVQPGCEIVVPEKVRNEGALQNVLSIATTSASLATMIATIGNIIK